MSPYFLQNVFEDVLFDDEWIMTKYSGNFEVEIMTFNDEQLCDRVNDFGATYI